MTKRTRNTQVTKKVTTATKEAVTDATKVVPADTVVTEPVTTDTVTTPAETLLDTVTTPAEEPVTTDTVATPAETLLDTVTTPAEEPAVPDNKFTAGLQAAIDVLVDVNTMLTPETVVKAQVAFYHGLVRGIVTPTPDVAKMFIVDILTMMNANADAFTPATTYREFRHLTEHGLSDKMVKEFEMLLSILKDSVEPETRFTNAQAMSWDNVSTAFTGTYNQILLDRLKSFFKV